MLENTQTAENENNHGERKKNDASMEKCGRNVYKYDESGVEVFLLNDEYEYKDIMKYIQDDNSSFPNLMTASFAEESDYDDDDDDDDDDDMLSQCTFLSAVDEMSYVSTSSQQRKEQQLSTSMTVEGIYTRKVKKPSKATSMNEDGNLRRHFDKKYYMRRRRLWTEPMDPALRNKNKKYSKAMFVKGVGLENSKFRVDWNKALEERSVLIQSVEHYEQLKHHSVFGQFFNKDNNDYMLSPSFGEQIIVKGMDSSDICIGDIFEVKGGSDISTLVLEVTSPRLPRATIDKRHGARVEDGTSMKEYTKVHALAGWFARILVDGELRDGMTLQRTQHPLPKWTLAYTSLVLYGEGNAIEQTFHKPTWNHRPTKELYELSKIPQLANYQWKDKAKYLLYKQYYISHVLQKQSIYTIFDSVFNNLLCVTDLPWNNQDETTDGNDEIIKSSEEKQQQSTVIPSYTIPYLPDDNQIQTTPSLSMSVKGVYKKVKIPRKSELPWGFTAKDLAPDQQMPRVRIHLRNVSSQQLQEDENNKNNGEKMNYEKAYFIPGKGLVKTTALFHSDEAQEHKYNNGILEDRAILWQSTEHYETIKSNSLYKDKLQEEDYLIKPTFGEQVIISGCNSSQICIGDVFEVEGRSSPLVVEVTAPRKPCFVVDAKFETKGLKGMKRYTMTNALAGWLTRVLVPGELLDDMNLVRTRNPHPKWTLTFISKVLLSEGSKLQLNCGKAHWARDDLSELIELVNLPQLGHYEWKEDAEELLWKELKKKKESLDEIIESDNDSQEYSFFEYFNNFTVNICSPCYNDDVW